MIPAYTAVIDSPIGKLGIISQEQFITGVDFLTANAFLLAPVNELAQTAVNQIEQYFNNAAHCFTLPLKPAGTAFQQAVWQTVNAIAPGNTLTYGDIAKQLHSGPRAVGNACRRNPIPIIIPCHRIIGANSLGGYSGSTTSPIMDIKNWLLKHEQPFSH